MRKNVGVSYYILEYLKELDYGARLTDFYNHFPDTKEQTIRSTFDDEIITETLNIESSKFRKKNIYRKFLQLIVENIEVSTDHSIKIQYIQEWRKLLKEMRWQVGI